MPEKTQEISREIEQLKEDMDRLFSEMGGLGALLLTRTSKAAM